ncbi:MAG TPA: c-type cytochrome [Planctomycetaceae bacterium]|nr:c-type cytochrome [Planctomycetaceae bacterium]
MTRAVEEMEQRMVLFDRPLGLILTIVVMLGTTCPSHAQRKFELSDDAVVVFAGGTNMVHLQQAGYLEAILTQAFSSARPKFRDLSWEADTVYRQGTVIERWRKDGFGSRDDQLKRLGATVVVAQFGRLESMAGQSGLKDFALQYGKLVDEFRKHAGRVVLLTPTPFESPASPLIPDLSKRNADLGKYVEAIANIAAERKLLLVDLFATSKPGLTNNGMHVKPAAQAGIAADVARQLGIDVPSKADLEPLRLAVVEKHRLWYDYWRPANWKLLYGDDARRQFTRGGQDYIPFKEEWNKLLPLLTTAEQRVWQIAVGGEDVGHNRPDAENLHGDEDANIKLELASFTVSNGLNINLFASDREGLTSPLAIRWDPTGRMYVAVTTAYPHVFPGDIPNDKIITLEDTDGDGTADKATVFAEGLNIPTGLEWGDGGVYVGQNTELLFLQDTDGDGVADKRQVVLGGFGNGDSHQTINSFIWSPGGELYFGQGDGIESRVETPWGVSNLFQAGFYRFRPRRLQLHPLLDDFMGPGNPWGIAFDRWGQIFSIDGAGGVTYLSPGQVPTTHRLRLDTIGKPGGYCGIGYLDGRNLPKSMHGDFAVGDYKSNRVQRFSVQEDGAGFSLRWNEPILQSKHRNFRPVDVKVGPDGALYVVDWYNPITCHQDDAYRDPTRDKAHGRIWRLSANTAPIRPPDFSTASTGEVLDGLMSPEHWTRYQSKRALTKRDPTSVASSLSQWVSALSPQDPEYEHHLYEALGAYATIEMIEPNLLLQLLRATDPRARAYATRIVGRWHDRLDDPLRLLSRSVSDDHPQVRMEAVLACAAIDSPHAIAIAARVVDKPVDKWIDYALTQAAHHLKPHWSPAFQRGEVSFAQPNHLATILNKAGGRNVLKSLKTMVDAEQLSPRSKEMAIAAILAVGGPNELRDYGLDPKPFTLSGRYDPALHAVALARLIEGARFRNVRPAGELGAALNRLIDHQHAKLKTHALVLAGVWKVNQSRENIQAAAENKALPVSVRAAAFGAMAEMQLPSSQHVLATFAVRPHDPSLRSAAIRSMVAVDTQAAAKHAAELLGESNLEALDLAATLVAFLNRKTTAVALAAELRAQRLTPQAAERILRSLYSTGRSDKQLVVILNQAIGASGQVLDYDREYVRRLVSEAMTEGDAMRGAVLFKTAACTTCHRIGDTGGVVGPDLTAIGTTLSGERIVEEILWPNRQVKEGYTVLQVLTNEGVLHQGYERRTKESQVSGDLVMRELASARFTTIKKEQIDLKQSVGSSMPTGLTALLTQPQMVDLIRYVSDLGKNK